MATTKYRCTNYGECDKALQHELIEIEDGEEAVCPQDGCGHKLQPLKGAKPAGSATPAWVYAAVAVIVLAVGAGLLFSHTSQKHGPDAANKMLSDFYPQLPAK